MDTYVYEYGSGLYVNLTNRCNNNCAFCLRHTNQGVGSHRLWLEHEPTAEQVIEKMQDLSAYEEVVFCGFGEPTLAWETLKQIAAYVKQQGKPVRVNTNGLGNLANGRDITPEAEGLVDTFSISLNAATPEAYQELCHSQYGCKLCLHCWSLPSWRPVVCRMSCLPWWIPSGRKRLKNPANWHSAAAQSCG